MRTDGAGDFSISCVRTVRVHTACSVRTLTWGVFLWLPRFFGQCSPISVSAPSGPSGRLGLAHGVGGEVVMVHISLADLVLVQAVDPLGLGQIGRAHV